MTVKYITRICYTFLPLLLLTMNLAAPIPVMADEPGIPAHNIAVEFDLEAHALRGVSRIELPTGTSLQLDLAGLEVSGIMINGQPAEVPPDNTYIVIDASAVTQEITINYTKAIPAGGTAYDLVSTGGITLTGHWYPLTDREMLFNLTALIPADFEAVSEAEEIISFPKGNAKLVICRFPHPLPGINFVAGPYVVTLDNFGDGRELAAYFFAEDQELAAGYMEKTRQYLQRYGELIGPYPYKRFAIVENRLPTGYAMPTFTLLGQAVVRLPFIVDTSLGHEVLHEWFGSGVRLGHGEGNWVEGLTTYLADHAFAADRGEETVHRKEQLVKYQSFVRPELDLTLRKFSNAGHTDIGGKPLRAVGYNKSSMFFHMLRKKVGDDAFTTALQDFYQRRLHKGAGWQDLQASFESIAGLDLNAFFSQWLDRNDVPDLIVENIAVGNDQGHPVLRFDIRQANKDPYELELPAFITAGGKELRQLLVLSYPSTSFEIPLDSTPEKLVIDPGYDVMRTLSPDELPATWSQFLGAKGKIAILPSEEARTRFSALLEELQAGEVRILLQDEVNDKDLAENSLIFLGTEGRMSRSLFAETDHPKDAFTLDVRKNPLNVSLVAVLVSSADAEQAAAAAAKLRHYEKYSYLSFQNGRIREKRISETDSGLRVPLVRLPGGIEASKTRNFDDILDTLLNYQVIYIGEGHTNYEDHLLQLELIRALYRHDPDMAIGMEMFTRETQPVLDRYLADELDERTFLKESHYFKIWRFDYRLYRDIINFAKHNSIPLIGLNLERDLVSQVFKEGGPNSLPEEDISVLPENRQLDIPGYTDRIRTAFMMHAGQSQNGDFGGFLQAQALWDETMAETITNYLNGHPNSRMVVIAGRGHVDKSNAIPPRVERRLPVSQAVVVNSLGSSTETATADFIFFAPPEEITPFPLLGVMLEDVADGEGVLVKALNPKGQAKEAGIREKDIILAIGPDTVRDNEDVKIAMLYQVDSDAVTVRLKRKQFFGEKIMEIEVKLQKPGGMGH